MKRLISVSCEAFRVQNLKGDFGRTNDLDNNKTDRCARYLSVLFIC